MSFSNLLRNKPSDKWMAQELSGGGLDRFLIEVKNTPIVVMATFITLECVSKYKNVSVFPVDILSFTQLLITLDKLGQFETHKEIAVKFMRWTIENMQSTKGYFYYQINKHFTSKIPYMRWAQAWMFLSFTVLFKKEISFYKNMSSEKGA